MTRRIASRFMGATLSHDPAFATEIRRTRSPTLFRPWQPPEQLKTRFGWRSSARVPAGFYAAEHLLKRDDVAVEVDMFDRLPTPFGLVRAGVAPDHPKIKSVIRVYEKTAARDGYQFFGNVDIGADVTVAELEQRYHAVVSRLRDRHRPPARDPGRGPSRLARGHRVRQLVQRPPRLRRPRLRPLGQARGRDRQRQRRRRRGADARPAARGARRHRHRRPRDRRALRLRDRGDRRPRPPRARAGRVHQPRGARARRAHRRRHRHRPGRHGAGRSEPRLRRVRRVRSDPPAQRRDLHRVRPP